MLERVVAAPDGVEGPDRGIRQRSAGHDFAGVDVDGADAAAAERVGEYVAGPPLWRPQRRPGVERPVAGAVAADDAQPAAGEVGDPRVRAGAAPAGEADVR